MRTRADEVPTVAKTLVTGLAEVAGGNATGPTAIKAAMTTEMSRDLAITSWKTLCCRA